jgi:TonB-linked SusC/RagA family outer membrane protein
MELKIAILIVVVSVSGVFAADTYSQGAKVTLDLGSSTLEKVMDEIEKQSEFYFIFNQKQIDVSRTVTIKAENKLIDEILSEIFKSTNVNYAVLDRKILLTTEPVNVSSTLFRAGSLQQTVSGRITDSGSGEGMPGVNILIRGTTTGTISDMNGRYSIPVADLNATLVFSFIGYLSMEVPIGGRTNIDVALTSEMLGLDEVVVIGYGTASKRTIASATSVVGSQELTRVSTTDTRQALQGKLSGVKVVTQSGDPGANTKIVIRGLGSFSNTDPLYVIDGIQGGDIRSIPSENIESITVLKDAATTAIYGSAAANGVVLITTKSGKKGRVIVNYTGSTGFDNVARRLDLLNASEYVDLVKDIQETNNQAITAKLGSDYVQVDRTDWQDAVFRRALFTDNNLSLSGGGENVTYSFLAGYMKQESTVIDRNLQRFTINAKITEDLFNGRLRLNQSIRLKGDLIEGLIADLNNTLRMAPYTPILDPDNLGGYARMDKLTDLQDANNPYATVYNSEYRGSDWNNEFEFSGEIDIIRGLMFKSQGRVSVWNGENYTYDYLCNGGNFQRLELTMMQSFMSGRNFILENFFSFNRSFGKHIVSGTLGNTFDPARVYRSMSASAAGFSSDVLQNISLANKTSISAAEVNSGSSRLSYFARASYTYANKYILNASLRRDASSKFGENNRWGTFYGVGVAWALSDEEFMQGVDAISDLKLRASFGKLGNDNIPGFLGSQPVWKGVSNTLVYSFGDGTTYVPGSTIYSIPNPDLRWEETNQMDLGVDLGFLNNRVTVVMDYFHRNNTDLLIETLLPYSSGVGLPTNVGVQGTKWLNAASMVNKGVEAAITYSKNSGEFKWDISLNATYSVNEVTALGTTGDLPITGGPFGSGFYATRTDIGQPITSFFGYVVDHVIVSQAELNALNESAAQVSNGAVTQYQVNAKPGDFLWDDVDGNGWVDVNDRTFLGDPSPKWQFGASLNAFFKNLDFHLMIYGLADVSVVNANNYWWKGSSKPFNTTTDLLRRWKQDGDVTDIPRAGQNSGSNLLMSSFYVEKGDFLKIRNISLGYTLPNGLFNRAISSIRISANIQNALTLTKYTGYDPEVSSSGSGDRDFIFNNGIDNQLRPVPRMIRFGAQITF